MHGASERLAEYPRKLVPKAFFIIDSPTKYNAVSYAMGVVEVGMISGVMFSSSNLSGAGHSRLPLSANKFINMASTARDCRWGALLFCTSTIGK